MKKIFVLALALFLFAACTPTTFDTFATISGTVVDYSTGSPIQNVTITLNPSGKNTFTGSDGFFQFNDLDPQQYKLTAQKEGYESNSKSVNPSAGETVIVAIDLRKKQ